MSYLDKMPVDPAWAGGPYVAVDEYGLAVTSGEYGTCDYMRFTQAVELHAALGQWIAEYTKSRSGNPPWDDFEPAPPDDVRATCGRALSTGQPCPAHTPEHRAD